jgi:hypothetical protein
MKYRNLFLIVSLVLISAALSPAQTKTAAPPESVRASPAFAEIILRSTELESELEELLTSYTEEFPRVKERRYELKFLQADLERISKMKPAEAGKLTLALGKLLVRRAQLATDHQFLKDRYNEEHPDVKKAKRKLDIFDNAIKKIMG